MGSILSMHLHMHMGITVLSPAPALIQLTADGVNVTGMYSNNAGKMTVEMQQY